jgi:hypothetical protein
MANGEFTGKTRAGGAPYLRSRPGCRPWFGDIEESEMRTMLKITMPVEAGNRAIKDGRLNKIIQATIAKLKPEASYFVADAGVRSAMFFFDMKDSSEIPIIAEPLFIELEAKVELYPAMNAADLQKGLAAAMAAM